MILGSVAGGGVCPVVSLAHWRSCASTWDPTTLAWSDQTARLARQHNDANVLSLGERQYSIEEAVEFAKIFVSTPFSGEPRHTRRLAMIADYEKSGAVPPLPAE